MDAAAGAGAGAGGSSVSTKMTGKRKKEVKDEVVPDKNKPESTPMGKQTRLLELPGFTTREERLMEQESKKGVLEQKEFMSCIDFPLEAKLRADPVLLLRGLPRPYYAEAQQHGMYTHLKAICNANRFIKSEGGMETETEKLPESSYIVTDRRRIVVPFENSDMVAIVCEDWTEFYVLFFRGGFPQQALLAN